MQQILRAWVSQTATPSEEVDDWCDFDEGPQRARDSTYPHEKIKGKIDMIGQGGWSGLLESGRGRRAEPTAGVAPALQTPRRAMAATTQCNQCGVVLNVPDQALGKRLKCPHCGARFGTVPGDPRSAESSFLLQSPEALPAPAKADSRPDDSVEALPTVSGEVKETYDRSLEKEIGAPAKAAAAARTAPARTPVADALALFDDGPKKPRRVSAAEARSQARRCPGCGGVVPAGMSLCATCGLDLETGARATPEHDLDVAPTPPVPPLPLPVAVIGGITLAGSVVLTVLALALWLQGSEGYQYFVPIGLFSVFASVQLLRQKSVRLLVIALSFGLAIDIVSLIAMPIYRANVEASGIERTADHELPEGTEMIIPSVVERLDTRSLTVGIVLIGVYAGVALYLTSPQVTRHFR
jgi:hypothetical protein